MRAQRKSAGHMIHLIAIGKGGPGWTPASRVDACLRLHPRRCGWAEVKRGTVDPSVGACDRDREGPARRLPQENNGWDREVSGAEHEHGRVDGIEEVSGAEHEHG